MKIYSNKNKEPLTIERLKKFQGLGAVSDEEAEVIINQLKFISTVLIDVLKHEELENNIQLKEAA